MFNLNERSLAIDIISKINELVKNKKQEIGYAGGESTLKNNKKVLFPDVILYTNELKTDVLQGWELKLPDTPIDDLELIENAYKKAILFGVNSFLVWNISCAKLYKIEGKTRKCIKEWNNLSHVTKRNEIKVHEVFNMLEIILLDLNSYFINNELKKGKTIESIGNETFIELLFKNTGNLIDNLIANSRKDSKFDDELVLWWSSEKLSFGKKADKWEELSKIIIISIVNKIIYANILKKYRKEAKLVESIDKTTTALEGLRIFEEISKKCDFYNIFEEKMGEKYIDNLSWELFIEFNDFLNQLQIDNYESSILEELLSKVVTRSKRRISGQFSTPKELAYLLVGISLENKEGFILDPCCGTGTISRASYEIKKEYQINEKEALNQVWASDKFRYPLQMAMLALSTPENIGEKINIFKHDVFEFDENKKILLHNPNNGSEIQEYLPKFDTIVSNLPFVQQEYLNKEAMSTISKKLYLKYSESLRLEGKSDLYSYIPFSILDILKENGTLGIIVSNSWLGTKWGKTFFELLTKYFKVKYILLSGNGRWFENADVVTNIIVCEKKKEAKEDLEEITSFILLKTNIKKFILNEDNSLNYDNLKQLVANIRLSKINTTILEKNSYSLAQIISAQKQGLILNSLFTDCNWIFGIKNKLCKVTNYFDIARGERRGQDKLFFPTGKHNIEPEYIVPVIKNSKNCEYIANNFSDAFCCGKSLEELENTSHFGAINWIKNFEDKTNGTGKPLPKVLARKGLKWYEMSDSTIADIALSLNPDKRLFFTRLEKRSFVNQRLIRLTSKNKNEDIILLSAILNSILGLFYIEAIGFGRGLGALDLSSEKLKNQFHILNPKLLKKEDINEIKKLYLKIENRKVLPILKELENEDRILFDKKVLESFEISNQYDNIKNSLINLYKIRKSVENK